MLFLLLALLLSQITGKSHELIKVTPTNLQRLLRHHPMLLIYVYSAEHGPSAILKEDLEHTMRLFAFEHSQIELAELEVSSFGDSLPNFATKAAIPLVSLHLNGRHHIYSKEKLQTKDIQYFIRAVYFKNFFVEVQSARDLQVHVQGGEDLVLYHGPKKSAKLNSLIDWATTHRRNKVKFIFCDTSKVSLQVAEPNSLSLYHQATQTWSVYKAKMHSRHNFEHWLAQHARSWIRHMSRDTYRKIAIDGHPSAVLFSRNKAEQAQQARDWDFEQLAEQHKGALLFSYCDLQADSHCARLLALLQLTQDDLPSLTLVHCPEGEDQDLAFKYLPSSVLPKPEAARSLLSSFNSGEAVPFIRTEAEASQDDQGVLRLAAADVSSRLKFNKRREHDAVVLFHEGKDSPSSSRVDRPHPDSQDI